MRSPTRAGPARRRGALAVAAAASAAWLGLVALFVGVLGAQGAMWLGLAVAVLLPLAGIWLAALLARQAAALSAEAHRLEAAAAALATAQRTAEPPRPAAPRQAAAIRHEPGPAAPRGEPTAAPRREPTPAAPRPESPPAALPRRPDPAAAPADHPAPRQGSLPLPIEPAPVALPLADLARALDFPSGEDDEEGFRTLRMALRDPRVRRLVQASQDILTLLAEDGIYMDDLAPVPAPPEAWRRFAAGERTAVTRAVGGLRDEAPLLRAVERMRADPVFRDAAHHFLRHFDGTLTQIAPEASDDDLARLADTRTARAFMLVGRAAGIFD